MAHKRRRQYFDLLALPAELRLKVYECLPRRIHHNIVHTQLNKHDDDQSSRGVILITRSLPVVMLRLNKQIHREAKETVRRLAERFILDAVPRVIAMGIESSYHELRAIMRQIPCEHLLLSQHPTLWLHGFESRHPFTPLHSASNKPPFEYYRFLHQAAKCFVHQGVDTGKIAMATCHGVAPEDTDKYFINLSKALNRMVWAQSLCQRYSTYNVNLVNLGIIRSPESASDRPTADTVPEIWASWNVAERNFRPHPTMSRQTWIGEWLPS